MTLAYASWHPGASDSTPIPAVIALHGHGAHGMDLLGLSPYLAQGRVLVLCPQAQFAIGPSSYTWFDRPPEGQRPVEEVDRVATELLAFIDEVVPKNGGDLGRVALLGFSQGGTLAYRIGLAQPRRFAGVAALSTYFPDDIAGAIDNNEIDQVPLLIQHGVNDTTVAVERARASRELLETMGAHPEYHEYPMRHEIGRQSLTDLSGWLMRVLGLAETGA